MTQAGDGRGLTRRAVLRGGGALAFAVFAARDVSALGSVVVPVGADRPGFLGDPHLRTLRAVVDRFVPGRPEDPDEGAVAAGCAEAIDALLGAFTVEPPLIYAGAPFSDRAGSDTNFFERFLELDAYEQRAWKLRIEGSKGEDAVNGPVQGLQGVYTEGLDAVERAAAPASFADLPAPARDAILRTSGDPAVRRLVDVAFPHTLEFLYGAPEYHGNQGLIGWRYTNYAGDQQPDGYTADQIEKPDEPGLAEAQPRPPVSVPLEKLLGLAALASPEMAHTVVGRSGGTLEGLRAELEGVRGLLEKGRGRAR